VVQRPTLSAMGRNPMRGPACGYLVLVMRRSRSKMAEATRQPRRTRIRSPAPNAMVTGRGAGITLNAMSVVTATEGRLARRASCAAVRGSLERADTAMPIQMDTATRSGVNRSWASRSGLG